MFSGIVEQTAKADNIKKEKGGLRLFFKSSKSFKVKVGESVSADGVCSTVEKASGATLSFFYMPETLKKTTFSNLPNSHQFNLERPLKLQDLVSGHLVSGHIDTTAQVSSVKKGKDSTILKFKIAPKFTKYIIYKGSIAVNGVSLTVVSVNKNQFSVSLIPYTLSHTNLGQLKVGNRVNIEIDQVAKYLEKLINK